MTFSILMLIFVSLAYTSWTNGQDSGAMIRIFMKKRSSFDGNLPLTSACYNSEMKFTNPVQCASQCLTRIELCHGILFNQEYGTCKLIKCNPADAFSVGQFNSGRWELFWRENGIKYTDFISLFLSLSLSLSLSQQEWEWLLVIVTSVIILSCGINNDHKANRCR